MIEIAKWNLTFENSDTRKRQRLKSFHCPSGIESRGLLNLLCHFKNQDALAAFGVFQLICQLSATLPADHRGKLLHSDGTAMEMEFVARLLRIEICHLSDALEILADKRIAWVVLHENSDNLPTICHQSPGFVQVEGEVEVEEEGEGEAPKNARPPEVASDRYPTETAKQFDECRKRINSMNPAWKTALVRSEMEELHANAAVFFDLTENDWRLLKAYMHAEIPEYLGKFWQPNHRSQFIRSISDICTHADNWQRACKKNHEPTGLEMVKSA